MLIVKIQIYKIKLMQSPVLQLVHIQHYQVDHRTADSGIQIVAVHQSQPNNILLEQILIHYIFHYF